MTKLKVGSWCLYNSELGIINEIAQQGDLTWVRIHFVEPDGTTRMKLNEEDWENPFPVTDYRDVVIDKNDMFELLESSDERIPESRRQQ